MLILQKYTLADICLFFFYTEVNGIPDDPFKIMALQMT